MPPFRYFIWTNAVHVVLLLALYIKNDGTCDRLFASAANHAMPDYTICETYIKYVGVVMVMVEIHR